MAVGNCVGWKSICMVLSVWVGVHAPRHRICPDQLCREGVYCSDSVPILLRDNLPLLLLSSSAGTTVCCLQDEKFSSKRSDHNNYNSATTFTPTTDINNSATKVKKVKEVHWCCRDSTHRCCGDRRILHDRGIRLVDQPCTWVDVCSCHDHIPRGHTHNSGLCAYSLSACATPAPIH